MVILIRLDLIIHTPLLLLIVPALFIGGAGKIGYSEPLACCFGQDDSCKRCIEVKIQLADDRSVERKAVEYFMLKKGYGMSVMKNIHTCPIGVSSYAPVWP